MPPEAWCRPTGARTGQRPAWRSVWARWRETEVHHVDLDAGYPHGHWPAGFADLLLPRILPALDTRLAGRPVPAAAGLTASRSGQGWPLPRLRPWA